MSSFITSFPLFFLIFFFFKVGFLLIEFCAPDDLSVFFLFKDNTSEFFNCKEFTFLISTLVEQEDKLNILANFPLVKFGEDFILSVFSPSKVPVSIKHTPSGKLESINIKSAGKIPSNFTLTISPILKSPLFILIQFPSLYISTSFEFCSLSKLLLFKSSIASRIKDTHKTKTNGRIAVAAPNGLIIGIL